VANKNKKAKTSFSKLTPGLQREFTNYIDDAKQEATKLRRLEKSLSLLLKGKGLNDKYRH